MRDYELKEMIDKQALLSYGLHITKQDSDNMTPNELEIWFNSLIEIKRKEAEINSSKDI